MWENVTCWWHNRVLWGGEEAVTTCHVTGTELKSRSWVKSKSWYLPPLGELVILTVACCVVRSGRAGGGGGTATGGGAEAKFLLCHLTVIKLELKVGSNHAVDLFRVSSSSALDVYVLLYLLMCIYYLHYVKWVFVAVFLFRLKESGTASTFYMSELWVPVNMELDIVVCI